MKKTLAALLMIPVLAGCAAQPPQNLSTIESPGATAPTTVQPQPTASATPEATPEPTPTPEPEPTVEPIDTKIGLRRPAYEDKPLPTLTAAQQEKYGACLEATVTNYSKGACATLLQEDLKELGYLEGAVQPRIGVAAMNAILRYQRSREVRPDGNAGPQTWYALASGRPARTTDLPRECAEIPGVVLCIDQAHSTLKFVRDGVVEKTIDVRLGGWTSDAKTKKWRVFPTAPGLWRVYNKHRNPSSPTYGEGVMPYSVMFDPNMYVHYSADFAKHGYARSSHGCVNVASKEDAKWVFDNTPIEARVWVY